MIKKKENGFSFIMRVFNYVFIYDWEYNLQNLLHYSDQTLRVLFDKY